MKPKTKHSLLDRRRWKGKGGFCGLEIIRFTQSSTRGSGRRYKKMDPTLRSEESTRKIWIEWIGMLRNRLYGWCQSPNNTG